MPARTQKQWYDDHDDMTERFNDESKSASSRRLGSVLQKTCGIILSSTSAPCFLAAFAAKEQTKPLCRRLWMDRPMKQTPTQNSTEHTRRWGLGSYFSLITWLERKWVMNYHTFLAFEWILKIFSCCKILSILAYDTLHPVWSQLQVLNLFVIGLTVFFFKILKWCCFKEKV